MTDVVVNMARLSKSSTGMWQYSTKFVECLYKAGLLKGIICERSIAESFKQYGCEFIYTPVWVSNTKNVSRLRPILWFIYSWFLSLKIKSKYSELLCVSTTHHSLPGIKRQAITVHDLRPYFYPDSTLQKIYFRWLLPKAVHQCEKVLTVSNTVKSQIADVFDFPLGEISVIPNAIDCEEFSSKENNKTDKYFLSVGSNWKHKNIHSFLLNNDAWKNFGRLIIVCGKTAYYDYLVELVKQHDLTEKVEFQHDVKFSKLKELLANAYALIYPSIDEGFGIPPIESMASGTPVIVNNIPVFREVLGATAIYVNPNSLESWQKALNDLEQNYDELVTKGHDLAKHYSIQNMLESVRKAFN